MWRWRGGWIAKDQLPGEPTVAVGAGQCLAATGWPAAQLFGQEIGLNLGPAAIAIVIEARVLRRQQHVGCVFLRRFASGPEVKVEQAQAAIVIQVQLQKPRRIGKCGS